MWGSVNNMMCGKSVNNMMCGKSVNNMMYEESVNIMMCWKVLILCVGKVLII